MVLLVLCKWSKFPIVLKPFKAFKTHLFTELSSSCFFSYVTPRPCCQHPSGRHPSILVKSRISNNFWRKCSHSQPLNFCKNKPKSSLGPHPIWGNPVNVSFWRQLQKSIGCSSPSNIVLLSVSWQVGLCFFFFPPNALLDKWSVLLYSN